MRLEPLYTVTFTTPEAWSVEVAADAPAPSAYDRHPRYLWLNERVCALEGEVSARLGTNLE